MIAWGIISFSTFVANTVTQAIHGACPWGKLTFKKSIMISLLWPFFLIKGLIVICINIYK